MEQWISKDLLLWISVAGLLIGMVVVPWLMVRMPADSFSNEQRYAWLDRKPAGVRVPLRILKNLLAVGLIMLGAMMFVTPGPGIFPIVLGIFLADFPWKEHSPAVDLVPTQSHEQYELGAKAISTPAPSIPVCSRFALEAGAERGYGLGSRVVGGRRGFLCFSRSWSMSLKASS